VATPGAHEPRGQGSTGGIGVGVGGGGAAGGTIGPGPGPGIGPGPGGGGGAPGGGGGGSPAQGWAAPRPTVKGKFLACRRNGSVTRAIEANEEKAIRTLLARGKTRIVSSAFAAAVGAMGTLPLGGVSSESSSHNCGFRSQAAPPPPALGRLVGHPSQGGAGGGGGGSSGHGPARVKRGRGLNAPDQARPQSTRVLSWASRTRMRMNRNRGCHSTVRETRGAS
jgi:hypothetical protein